MIKVIKQLLESEHILVTGVLDEYAIKKSIKGIKRLKNKWKKIYKIIKQCAQWLMIMENNLKIQNGNWLNNPDHFNRILVITNDSE